MSYYIRQFEEINIIIKIDNERITSFHENSPGNKDWEDYQEWIASGNQPLSWPPE